MSNENYIFKTRGVVGAVLFLNIPVALLFFTSANVKNVWPIGAGLILLSLNAARVAYFYEDRIVIVKPFLRIKREISYENIVRINFSPRVALQSSGFGMYYRNAKGKERKLGFNLYKESFDDFKAFLLQKNSSVKFTIWDEPIRKENPGAGRNHPRRR